MIEVNCRSFLSEFNASKFTVNLVLLTLSITLSLKFDGLVNYSFIVAFTPLWVLDGIVLLGFLTGFLSFLCRPPSRTDVGARNEFLAMALTFCEHLLLTSFQVLCCFKLEVNDEYIEQQLSWLFLFSPLFILSCFSMAVAIWSVRNDRTFEFELLISINILQLVFTALKLDGNLNWSWAIVFLPTWILFSLYFILTFYSLALSVFVGRTNHFVSAHRRSHFFNAVFHMLLTIPLLIFVIFLTDKLDTLESGTPKHGEMPYLLVALPAIISLAVSILMSFGSKSGNTWWFGMRKPFCSYIFETLPCLQQYANISYRFGTDSADGGFPLSRARQVVSQSVASPTPSNNSEQVQMLRNDDRVFVKMNLPNPSSIESPD